MNTMQTMDERIWDYLDGTATPAEKAEIEKLIGSSLEWKNKYRELLEVQQLISGQLELDEPSMRFTQNVMEAIGKFQIAPATKNYIDKKIIWGIGIFFLTMILGFLIYGIGQIDWSASGQGNLISFDLSAFNWSKLLNNTYTNIFMMVNVVLGLMLLDMYLGRRKRQMQEKHAI